MLTLSIQQCVCHILYNLLYENVHNPTATLFATVLTHSDCTSGLLYIVVQCDHFFVSKGNRPKSETFETSCFSPVNIHANSLSLFSFSLSLSLSISSIEHNANYWIYLVVCILCVCAWSRRRRCLVTTALYLKTQTFSHTQSWTQVLCQCWWWWWLRYCRPWHTDGRATVVADPPTDVDRRRRRLRHTGIYIGVFSLSFSHFMFHLVFIFKSSVGFLQSAIRFSA